MFGQIKTLLTKSVFIILFHNHTNQGKELLKYLQLAKRRVKMYGVKLTSTASYCVIDHVGIIVGNIVGYICVKHGEGAGATLLCWSTKWVDYVEEPMKYQAFLHHFQGRIQGGPGPPDHQK